MEKETFIKNQEIRTVKIEELLSKYPPEYICENKEYCYKKALSVFKNQEGEIKFSRYFCKDIGGKEILELSDVEIISTSSYFDYQSDYSENTYYMNFADKLLFGYYDASNFAQDEIQTLEMPLLAACSNYIDENKTETLRAYTVEKNQPTPFIFYNVPYWLHIEISPDRNSPKNIYGRNFRNASKELLDELIKPVEKDISLNIIAARAPAGGNGEYKKSEIEYFLKCSVLAFEAAVRNAANSSKVTIHSGNFGTGAFGNSIEMSYLIQLIAAGLAGVKTLYIHAADEEVLEKIKNMISDLPQELSFEEIVDFLEGLKLTWQTSDFN